jgi:phosphoribosyl 1,2-cyclic phosphodiesterase
LQVEFWGVRGSIACGGADYAQYGGNTSCVAFRANGQVLIVDAGTGLRPLGERLVSERHHKISILLSHTHFDHVCGIPFFAPAYDPGCEVTIWSGHLQSGMDGATRDVMDRLMEAPLFPVDPDVFRARLVYRDFAPGHDIDPGPGFLVHTERLNHPNGATAYRVAAGGKSVVYASDHEHGNAAADGALIRFSSKADLLIYDATYTEHSYERHRGWGHSTWQAGLSVAQAAGVKSMALFHHDPAATDSVLSGTEKEAAAAGRKAGVKVFAAREGAIWAG